MSDTTKLTDRPAQPAVGSARGSAEGGCVLHETTAMLVQEKSIFEQGSPGRTGASLPKLDVPEKGLEVPAEQLRKTAPGLPELS
jgi:hypothetical protein